MTRQKPPALGTAASKLVGKRELPVLAQRYLENAILDRGGAFHEEIG
jgi:hypothetical protein